MSVLFQIPPYQDFGIRCALPKKRVFILFTFFLFLLPGSLVYSDAKGLKKEILGKEKYLKDLKSDIAKRKEGVNALEKKRRKLLDELHTLDMELKDKEEAIDRIREQTGKVNKAILSFERKLMAVKGKMSGLEDELAGRLAAAYKMRQGGLMMVLLSQNGVGSVRRRYKYLESLMLYDMNLIKEYQDTALSLSEAKNALEKKRQTLAGLRESELRYKRSILKGRRRKKYLIRKVKSDRDLNLIALRGLEEASLRLESKIGELKKKLRYASMPLTSDFASLKGSFIMPVKGRVVSFYGKLRDPELKTVIFNKGIEIKAPEGAEIKSVYRGRVIYSDWFKGYGKMIIVDNGDGYYTVFAHLSKALKRVGEDVAQGELIGFVGDTDSLKGPYLYFEIRYRGIPKDPLEWISMK